MAKEKRLIYLEDAIALFEQDIEENKIALRTAYHGDKDAIQSEMVGMRAAISLVNSLARNGFTVDAVEVARIEEVKQQILQIMDEFIAEYRHISQSSIDHFGGKADAMETAKRLVNAALHDLCSTNCGTKMDGDGNA